MKTHPYVVFTALTMLCGGIAYAQQAPATPSRDTSEVLTVTGCVQSEADYRAQHNEGKGGIAGTGIGESHEFVLRRVRTVSSDTLKPIRPRRSKGEDIYRLTGKLESELANAVGHRVAVSGYVKDQETNGTTKVADLPDMVVVGWHNISDQCPAPAPAR